MTDALAESEFLRKATYYRRLERFEKDERIYKLRLAHDLHDAAEALGDHRPDALDLLRKAINSPDDNLIDWRDRNPLLAWIRSDPEVAKAALQRLWDTQQPLGTRLNAFSTVLTTAGLSQPGTQLIVASTLLMAASPFDHPPVRTQPFRKASKELGLTGFTSSDSLSERYTKAIGLLDHLLGHSGGLLRDRLDAQSVIWCVYSSAWGDVPPDYDPFQADPSLPAESELATDPDLRDAPQTERLALYQARRGQGRFKYKLWELWGGCALTTCRVPEVVHAAHIKPWRHSSNAERLDPYNGLLLLPTFHYALDAGLITFAPDGELLVSDDLSSADAKLIGLSEGMALKKVPPRTAQYLAYHRENVFRSERRLKNGAA